MAFEFIGYFVIQISQTDQWLRYGLMVGGWASLNRHKKNDSRFNVNINDIDLNELNQPQWAGLNNQLLFR